MITPAVLLDDAMTDAQPQTGALTLGFGGKKGIHDLIDDCRRYSAAIILETNPNISNSRL